MSGLEKFMMLIDGLWPVCLESL